MCALKLILVYDTCIIFCWAFISVLKPFYFCQILKFFKKNKIKFFLACPFLKCLERKINICLTVSTWILISRILIEIHLELLGEKNVIRPVKAIPGDGYGRGFQVGGSHMHLWMIHIDVWQKPPQYCNGIILQLK